MLLCTRALKKRYKISIDELFYSRLVLTGGEAMDLQLVIIEASISKCSKANPGLTKKKHWISLALQWIGSEKKPREHRNRSNRIRRASYLFFPREIEGEGERARLKVKSETVRYWILRPNGLIWWILCQLQTRNANAERKLKWIVFFFFFP